MKDKSTSQNTIIHLESQPDGTMTSEVQNLNFTKMLQMMIPFIVDRSKAVFEAAKKTQDLTPVQLEDLKYTLYDTLNIVFSNALTMFAPEIEARPDITEDAILKAQNDILEAEMKKAGFLQNDGTPAKDYVPETKSPEPPVENPEKDDTPPFKTDTFIPGQMSIADFLKERQKNVKPE